MEFKTKFNFGDTTSNNSKPMAYDALLCGVNRDGQIIEKNGKKYKIHAYICQCRCHSGNLVHIRPCCNNGYVEHFEEIQDNAHNV